MKIEKLYPECKDYIWGGNKLKDEYGKATEKSPCAESWELSFHKDGLTRLANGKTLMESLTEHDLGENLKDFPFFPVLNKFIDANQANIAKDHDGETVFLARNAWHLNKAREDFPKVELKTTREQVF